jgi:hypothetical protein
LAARRWRWSGSHRRSLPSRCAPRSAERAPGAASQGRSGLR